MILAGFTVSTAEPNPGLSSTRIGMAKLARFNRLKNSARNCSDVCSRIAVFLNTAVSQLLKPGPHSEYGAAFPYKYGTGAA